MIALLFFSQQKHHRETLTATKGQGMVLVGSFQIKKYSGISNVVKDFSALELKFSASIM